MKTKSEIQIINPNLAIARYLILLAAVLLFIPGIIQAESVIATIPVGTGPEAIGVNSITNKIYAINYNTGTITVIDGATDTALTGPGYPIDIAPTAFPVGFGFNSATNLIYVTNIGIPNIAVINGATDTIITGIPMPPTAPGGETWPWGVGVNSVTNKIYVSDNWKSTVHVVDGTTQAIIPGEILLGAGTYPQDVGVNSTTNKIYVANSGGDSVSVIDGATDTVTITIPVGDNPIGIAVNSITNMIYVSNNGDDSVSVINGATNTVIATIPLGAWTAPWGARIDTNLNRIYVANSWGSSVSVIDGATNTVIETVSVGTDPRGIAVNSTLSKVYVTNYSDNTVSVIGTEEICNALDDDGDGSTDEDLGQTTCGTGDCQRTVDNCSAGSPQTCVPGTSNAEVCNGTDDNCDGQIDEGLGVDADADGHGDPASCVTDATLPIPYDDCADADGNNFPTNPEVCDNADNDCDAVIDNGLGVDADADGHGDPSSCVTDATLPIPYDDCADADGNNFPTNPEICDASDNDCDTIIDNGLGVDADADGHGDPASCVTDATLPIPYDDCADADGNNFPTNPEVCDNADNDCDTVIDNGLGVDADADGHGDPASCVTDATLPIPYDDCADADGNNFPTNPEICDIADNDCDTIIDNGLGVDADADGHGDPASCVTDATLPIPYDDCADADGNNFPTNPEVCDNADNDCDTVIDNGLGVDADADGHGDPASCVTDATLPIPYDDCSDADGNNFPTNPEVCDNADNDCDTVIDNGLGVDADADGHGDPASCVTDATLPIPYDDCADADGNNFPTNPEVCDNADNDCDAVIDDGLGVDADADGHGDPASCVTDASLPIPYDDCADADGNNFPTNPEVCDASDNDCDTIIDNGLGVDADADGHGDPASCVTDATLPIPYDDCADADGNNFPTNPEVCDASDNDCDTIIDNGLGVDADADGHGDPASCVTDATLPIPYDDCADADGNNFPTNPEICDIADNDCDTVIDNGLGVDADADGHGDPASCVTDATLPIPYDDCADADGNNFPTNPEVCDNADNDCDTIIDNGLGVDADADGHGDPASCVTDATLPIPYDDCADADGNNFPTNPEVCDNADNDCDTVIDNGLGVDADADGHGDPSSCITDATLPIPYDDCADADGNNFPTNPEVCDNADNDCDTVIDNGLGVDADADGHGDPASCVTDASLPIPYDDCADADGNNFPTNPEICDASDNDCDTIIDNGLGVDADADGHGDPSSCVTDATLPIPYDDCADADGNNFPTNPEVCDASDNDCDTIIDNGLGVDADADGHGDPASCVTDATLPIPYDDCADADGNNFPTNPEVCDNADNDCDTVIDNGLGVDADADGHGDPASCVTDATLPIPYDDCDDTDVNNFPTNPEVCDNADNDCDAVIDNDLGVDADGDGHGDPASCVTDDSLIISYNDCDDADGNNYPSNTEVCDASDNDCDGSTDEIPDIPTICGVGVCEGNTGILTCVDGLTIDTCDPLDGATIELCNDIDDNCDGLIDEICGDGLGNGGGCFIDSMTR